MEISNLKSNISFNKFTKHKVISSELRLRNIEDNNEDLISLDNVIMAPFQTTVTIRQENIDNPGQNDTDVQILADEENWAENTTVITGNTSERSESAEGLDQWEKDQEIKSISYIHYIGPALTSIIIASAFFSPIIMVLLPKVGMFQDAFSILTNQQKLMYSSCNIECKGYLLSLVFKVTLLGIGNWAIFFKSREAVMPRVFMLKTGVIILTTLCICSYWLFYVVQITEGMKTAIIGDLTEYRSLVNYAENFVDTILLIHFMAVMLIEVRHLKPRFYLKVVRTPDGLSKSYTIGQLSIQRAAIWILTKYYTEFSIYNPYLERLPIPKSSKRLQSSNFKFYNVDNDIAKTYEQSSRSGSGSDRAILAAQARRRDTSHNERFYEEYEYERRVRKRKARLITAAEEAFAHLKRISSNIGSTTNSLDPMEAAQAVFPSMARALQKFLRITRQQPRHSVDAILQRLAHCLAQDATPLTFLEPFFNAIPVLSSEKERQRNSQNWALICEGELPSRSLRDGCEFQLRQGEVALLCSIHHLPRFHITEQVALPKSNRFLLKLNSETSI